MRWFRREHQHVWAMQPGSWHYMGCLHQGCDEERRYTGPPRGIEQVKRDWTRWGPRTDGGHVEFGSILVEDVGF